MGNENTRICSHEKKCKMVVDTGTTLLTGPKEDVKRLLQMIRVEPKCANYRSMPDITFVIDKKEYVLTHEDYILTITSNVEVNDKILESSRHTSTLQRTK